MKKILLALSTALFALIFVFGLSTNAVKAATATTTISVPVSFTTDQIVDTLINNKIISKSKVEKVKKLFNNLTTVTKPTVTFLSPKSNDTFTAGKVGGIKYTSSGLNGSSFKISAVNQKTQVSYLLSSGSVIVGGNDGEAFTFPGSMTAGQYKIKFEVNNKENYVMYSDTFNIISSSATVCTTEYAPVCGSDGKTYSNKCQAGAAGVTVIATSECTTNTTRMTTTELDQGWYYGSFSQKKLGTPSNWTHSGEGTKDAKWSAPSTTQTNINGQCGSANSASLLTNPAKDLCAVGTAVANASNGSGGWTWKCNGVGNGTTASCSAPFVESNLPLSIKITAPSAGENLTVGQTYRIKWDSSSKIDKVTLGYSFGEGSLNWMDDNASYNIANKGYYDWKVNIGNTTNTKVRLWIIGYQTGVGSVDSYTDYFNVVPPSSESVPMPASAKVIDKGTFTLTYDSNKKESSLVAKQKISVTAGNKDVYIISADYSIERIGDKLPNGKGINPNDTKSSIENASNMSKETKTGTYGNSYNVFTVKAGQTATFDSYVTFVPKYMFSGLYSFYTNQISLVNKDISDWSQFSVNTVKTDGIAVVGEDVSLITSPTITSISPTSGLSGSTATINGSGFTSSDRIVWGGYDGDGNGYGLTLYPTSVSESQLKFTIPTLSYNSKVGTFTVYIQNKDNKISNKVSFSITAPINIVRAYIDSISPTSGPAGTVVTINGSGFTSSNKINWWYNSGGSNIVNTIINPTSISSTKIVFSIPSSLTANNPGTFVITVNDKGDGTMLSNGVSFSVTAPTSTTVTGQPVCGLFRGGTSEGTNMVASPNPPSSVADTDSACISYCNGSGPKAGDLCRRANTTIKTYTTSNLTTAFNQNLKPGNEGQQVTILQQTLKQIGLYSGEITGFFGDLTKKSVMKFQTANALDAVGEVGPKTRDLLNFVLSR